jgi:uncharacterized membrane protein
VDKSTWKNKGLWLSVAALLFLLVKAFGLEINEGQYSEIINSILGILVAAGILSNPKEGNWYKNE